MDSIGQKQKRFLLQQMAQNGSAPAAVPQPGAAATYALREGSGDPFLNPAPAAPGPLLSAVSAPPPAPVGPQAAALAEGAGVPQARPLTPAMVSTRASADANLTARAGGQSAYLKALAMAVPLQRQQLDAHYAALGRKEQYQRDREDRQIQYERDRERRGGLLAAAPELRRRAGEVEDDIAGIGGGRSPDAIRYHQSQMADARRRQGDIDRLLGSPLHPVERRSVMEQQAALDRDIAGIGGGLTAEAIDYQAAQLEDGQRRRARLGGSDEGSRMRALEEVLREAGGDPDLGYELNAKALALGQALTPQKQASRLRAEMFLRDPYGMSRPTKPDGSDAALAAAAGFNLADDIGSRDPTEALAQVRSQPDYAAGRKQAAQAAIVGVSVESLAAELEAAGVGPVARDLIVAEYQSELGKDRLPNYNPLVDPAAPGFY